MIVVVAPSSVVKEFPNPNVVNSTVGTCSDVSVDTFSINDVLSEMLDDSMTVVDIVIFTGTSVSLLSEGEVSAPFIVVGDVMPDNRDVVSAEKPTVDDHVVSSPG